MIDGTIVVERLSRDTPIPARVLEGLDQIDRAAFPEPDQYGPKLQELALKQPEAFWVAAIGGEYVGYLSIFRLKRNRLSRLLEREARRGRARLPDAISELWNELWTEKYNDGRLAHLYIDAIATKKPSRAFATAPASGEIRLALMSHAATDMLSAGFARVSISTVAVRDFLALYLERVTEHLRPVGPTATGPQGEKRRFYAGKNISAVQLSEDLNRLAHARVRRGLT